MAQKDRIEQETQHEKQREATKEVSVDPSDAEGGIEQETQHVKRSAAQQGDSDQDQNQENEESG